MQEQASGTRPLNLNSLYAEFWPLLNATLDALRDKSSANKVLQGAPLANFLRITAPTKPYGSELSTSNAAAAFRTLPLAVQNLLMAITDLNLKLSHSEDAINAALSEIYLRAATEGERCVAQDIASLEGFSEAVNARTTSLHTAAVQQVLGERFATFSTRALQALHEWGALSAQLGVAGLVSHDLSTIEGLLSALSDARRSLAAARHDLAQPRFEVPENSPQAQLDARFALRMQRHQIDAERSAKMAEHRNNPLALSQALGQLRLADEEIGAHLAALAEESPMKHSAQVQSAEHVLVELDARSRAIQSLVDQAHVLAVESSRLLEGIRAQVTREVAQDLESARAHAVACVAAASARLAEQREDALRKQEALVLHAREAEKTLAGELTLLSRSLRVDAGVLDACASAIAEASRSRRRARDLETLALHKAELHKIGRGLRAHLLRFVGGAVKA